MTNSFIIACGQQLEIDCPVVLWTDLNGYSFEKTGKFNHHNDYDLDKLKSTMKSFVLHHSVTKNAHETYVGLIGRGLSVNFIAGDDCDENGYASLYQTMDLKHGGWSQAHFNDISRGIEVSFDPQAWIHPGLYTKEQHATVVDKVHGISRKVFAPSDAQVKTIIALLKCLSENLDIPATFPKDDNGEYIKTVIPDAANWNGFLNHFNLTTSKIDTAGIQLEYIESELNK